ncbi:hypothetical protein [Gymnodinialimonas sp.]
MANDQCLKRKILEREFEATGNAAIASVLHHQAKMVEREKDQRQYATPRRKTKRSGDKPRRRDFKSPEGFNECGAVKGRSYASKAGARMERKQNGFPDIMRHPATINNMIVPLTGDAKAATDKCRCLMRDAFKNLSEGAQVSGAFQIAMESAAYLATIFPPSELPECLDPINRPDEVFALLHWHGVIADPYLTKQEVRQVLSDAFPGCRRICVSKVQPERVNKQGQITHGVQGYLEYAAMNKTEVKFDKPNQKKDAIIGFAMLGSQLTKKNRSFSFGKSLAVTGIEIDPGRILELEHMERLHDIKKNWKNLSFGEKFIHLWCSGAFVMLRKGQTWLKGCATLGDRFRVFLALVKKWCDDPSAESPCFYDYAKVVRE